MPDDLEDILSLIRNQTFIPPKALPLSARTGLQSPKPMTQIQSGIQPAFPTTAPAESPQQTQVAPQSAMPQPAPQTQVTPAVMPKPNKPTRAPTPPRPKPMKMQESPGIKDDKNDPKPMGIPDTKDPKPKSMEPFMPPPSGGKTADAFTVGEGLHAGTKVAMAAAGLVAGGPAGMMAGGMMADTMKPKRPDDEDQGFVPSLGAAHPSDLQSSQRKKKGSSFPALRDQIGMSESDQIVSAFRR